MILAALVFMWAATPPTGAPAAQPPERSRPLVVRVGVPRSADTTADDVFELGRELESVIRAALGGPVIESLPRLRIRVALGSDYQILDWMSQGLVDAAIVPDLTLALLTRDGQSVYEMDVDSDDMRKLLPQVAIAPVAWRIEAGQRPEIDPTLSPGDEFDAFLNDLVESVPGQSPTTERRLILASHLSSAGFLWPALRAQRRFEKAFATSHTFSVDEAWERFFSATRFAFDCETGIPCFEAAIASDRGRSSGRTIYTVFPGERSPRGDPSPSPAGAYREHLVCSAGAIRKTFGLQAGKEPSGLRVVASKPATDDSLEKLLTQPAIAALFAREPSFGTRPFSFTADEAVDLLRRQPAAEKLDDLALVLPGGGVKAAYQTRILDTLYDKDRPLLRNSAAPPYQNAAGSEAPLPVKTVIGTSGGALLGYFVAQQRAPAIPLFDVLWRNDRSKLLTSTDVFGWTDFPRYVSFVAVFATLCLLLLVFVRSPLGSSGRPSRRWRLIFGTMPVFVVAPHLIRAASHSNLEHVPEIEGVLYFVMTILVMYADQAAELHPDAGTLPPNAARRSKRFAFTFGAVGLVLVAAARPLNDWIRVDETPLPFIVVFAILALLYLIGTGFVSIGGVRIVRSSSWKVEILAPLVVVLLLCSINGVVSLPPLISAIGVLVVGVYYHAFAKKKQLRWLNAVLTAVALWLIASLNWTAEAAPVLHEFSTGFLSLRSLPVTPAALCRSVGLLLLILAGMLWAIQGKGYSWLPASEAAPAFVAILGHSFATFVILVALTQLAPGFVSPLELTGRYWLVLIPLAVALGLAIILAARSAHRRLRMLHDAVTFLSSAHPNGSVVEKRYLRILMIAIFAVVWWNVVEAPALYGNFSAQRYKNGAIQRFKDKMTSETSEMASVSASFQPTARFVTPANLLKQRGTRYFMFVPAGDLARADLPTQDSGGAHWTVVSASGAGEDGLTDCTPSQRDDFPGEVAFASGSPFPILAAHEIPDRLKSCLPKEDGGEAYVDGGYSNNVPVGAAHTLGARRVLIVESSSPLPPTTAKTHWWGRHWSRTPGKLILNAGRLPTYFFDRSQEIDRLSRKDMLVVSLAPSRDEPDWPPLFDFRSSTVASMERIAGDDIGKRIGRVESWSVPALVVPAWLNRSARAANQ